MAKNVHYRALSFVVFFPFFALHAGSDQSAKIVRVRHSKDYYLSAYEYVLRVDEREVGVLKSIQIPLLRWCIFYDFFVKPAYRGQGHGHYLLAYAMAHAQTGGASTIILQPGPFELVDGRYVAVKGAQRAAALQRLIQFYTWHQFKLMSGITLRCVACVLTIMYRLAGIDEDPWLLMVYRCAGRD